MPTAIAAVRNPVVISPPPSTSTPTAGRIAIGCPNVIAVMSMTNCMRMFGARLRNARPSRRDWSPGAADAPSGRSEGSVHSPKKSESMRTTSIEYVIG